MNLTALNQKPKVGVVIVNWNGYEITRACLQSVFRQSYSKCDVFVVDNGSTESSIYQIKVEFPSLSLICLPENIGFTGGYNRGIEKALTSDCEYIFLLNNDTIVDKNLLKEMIKIGITNPRCGIVTPKIYYYEKPTRIQSAGLQFSPWSGIVRMRGRKTLDCGQYDKVEEVPYASGCALLIKTKVIKKVGLLDEILFAYAEDIDWSIRARNAGYSILYAPLAKVWHKEEFGWAKHRSQSLRLYLSTRNVLWLVYKHGHWFHWFTVIPNFIFFGVGKYILLSLLRNDIYSILATIDGLTGFIRMLEKNPGFERVELEKINKYSKSRLNCKIKNV